MDLLISTLKLMSPFAPLFKPMCLLHLMYRDESFLWRLFVDTCNESVKIIGCLPTLVTKEVDASSKFNFSNIKYKYLCY